MAEKEWGCLEPFDIDDGELDGKTPQRCFVLGYELAMVKCRLEHNAESFTQLIHADNRDRIEKACEKSEREYKFFWPSDDRSEEWVELAVSEL